jgi:hypothetical protein
VTGGSTGGSTGVGTGGSTSAARTSAGGTANRPPRAVLVSGGEFSIAAEFEGFGRLADTLDSAAACLLAAGWRCSRLLLDPALGATATLDPVGAAEVLATASVVLARAAAAAGRCEALAAGLRAAARGYAAADDLSGRLAPLVSSARSSASLSGMAVALSAAALDSVGDPGSPLRPGRSRSGVAHSAALLGQLYADGRPRVRSRPAARNLDPAGPPRSTRDLIAALALRNRESDGGGIDVRVLTTAGADGRPRRAAIVDITGTRDWQLRPSGHSNIADLGTNLRALGNQPTSYEAGVLMALRRAGVRPGEPVMLVGHSQGGLIAARLATDLAGCREVRITHVVTVGSPVGLVDLPRSVQVLSIENRNDVVPELDAAANRRHAHQLTVRVDRGGPGVGARHSLDDAYLPAAADLDASTDPSLTAWRQSARPFLCADSVVTSAYAVDRQL